MVPLLKSEKAEIQGGELASPELSEATRSAWIMAGSHVPDKPQLGSAHHACVSKLTAAPTHVSRQAEQLLLRLLSDWAAPMATVTSKVRQPMDYLLMKSAFSFWCLNNCWKRGNKPGAPVGWLDEPKQVRKHRTSISSSTKEDRPLSFVFCSWISEQSHFQIVMFLLIWRFI